jgi:iron complex transport system ATP-binding protein
LDAVTFSLHAGERVAVLGPNGAGKTTLLRCITGAWKPDEGRVIWDGKELAAWPAGVLARRRAVVRQGGVLEFDFPVHEVVAMGLVPHGPRVQGRADTIVRESLSSVGALKLHDRRWNRLSGGEQQRVTLARTIAQLNGGSETESRALLLDEPTNHLDPVWQLEALSVASTLASGGVAVLAILHDLALASSWADRILLLHEGRVAALGTPEAVLTAERLQTVFQLEATMLPHPIHGRAWVIPTRARLNETNRPTETP